VEGLQDRIIEARNNGDHDHVAMDKASLLDVLERECKRNKDVPIKLRMRHGLKDIFAIVSPDYGVADAPQVLAEIADQMPKEAKGTFSYDPGTTSWEIRANLWTPIPVAQQAVGEPFEGYTSIQSRDNGTGSLGGGGGIFLIRCLNASTYVAEGLRMRRIHRSGVLVDLPAMMATANQSIEILCKAWGQGRNAALDCRVFDAQQTLIPIEQVIPGFYRGMLTARRGELVGVLPGRTEKHVKALAMAFDSERRNPNTVIRSDLAQGWTRYVQEQATPIRRDAERAIGAWMVNAEPVSYVAA
jgi:hypothetical protein